MNGSVGCGWRVSDARPLRPQLKEKTARWRNRTFEACAIVSMVSEPRILSIRLDENPCLLHAFMYLESVVVVVNLNPELGFAHPTNPPNPSSGYVSPLSLSPSNLKPDLRKPLNDLVVIRCFLGRLLGMVYSMLFAGLR